MLMLEETVNSIRSCHLCRKQHHVPKLGFEIWQAKRQLWESGQTEEFADSSHSRRHIQGSARLRLTYILLFASSWCAHPHVNTSTHTETQYSRAEMTSWFFNLLTDRKLVGDCFDNQLIVQVKTLTVVWLQLRRCKDLRFLETSTMRVTSSNICNKTVDKSIPAAVSEASNSEWQTEISRGRSAVIQTDCWMRKPADTRG